MQGDLKMTYHILWLEDGKHKICGSDPYYINEIRQNYPNLHFVKLFACSKTTIANLILTSIHVLFKLLFDDLMFNVASRFENNISAPAAFADFPNCCITLGCTDIELVTPKRMDL